MSDIALARGTCKWCKQEFTLDTNEDLRHADFESAYITCDHCGHGAEYNCRRELQYCEPNGLPDPQ